jgi:proline dehydrogenase
MALIDQAIVRVLPVVPRPVVRRISSRYIAGPALEDAVDTTWELNAAGKLATIDVLGEEISTERGAAEVVRAYRDTLRAIERERLGANVSVKPTAVGLGLGPEVCLRNLEMIVADAGERGTFVRIDMEDSSTTDDTLAIYRRLRQLGHDNVGVVLQACLRRTQRDVRALADLEPNVRLCKGIYVEPPEHAFQGFEEVRANFVETLALLLDQGSYVGIATHDDVLLAEGKRLVDERGLDREDYELQMLLGVREDRGDAVVAEGRRLRVYVPFGEDWYEYSLRRLQENPRVARHIAADTLGRLVPGGGRSG